MRILLIEDNAKLVASLTNGFEEEGFQVTSASTGSEGLDLARRGIDDAIVIDLGLPDIPGVEVLARIRSAPLRCPILVLTAQDAMEARVGALNAGADDYLIKPFAFEELVARLRALVRRATGPRWSPTSTAAVAMDDALSVRLRNRVVPLSPREHTMLGYLLRRRGEVVSRGDILREVFGYGFDPGTNVIDVHLAHLRRKLADGPVRIETIRGAGFRLEIEAT